MKRWKYISMGQNKKVTKILKMSHLLLDELSGWELQIKSSVKITPSDNLWEMKQDSKGYGIW